MTTNNTEPVDANATRLTLTVHAIVADDALPFFGAPPDAAGLARDVPDIVMGAFEGLFARAGCALVGFEVSAAWRVVYHDPEDDPQGGDEEVDA